MKKHYVRWVIVLSVLFTGGCGSTGAFNAGNLTDVQLSKANYKIVATSVKGEASSGYLLGFSTGLSGRQMKTFAIARVSGSGTIYSEAIENLWKNFRNKYGKVEGRKLALINVRYDTGALNLLIYSKPKVAVRADVIEFIQ